MGDSYGRYHRRPGSDGHDKGLSINLAAPRTLRIAANETGAGGRHEAFGITLCGFGVAFAGFAVVLAT